MAAAIGKVGEYDIIFAGRQAIDGDTAQVGPQIAEKLGLPQVTYVSEFKLSEDKKCITVKRELEDGYELIEIGMPSMLTTIKELNIPRYMSIGGIYDACRKEIPTWSVSDLGVNAETEVGLDASPTKVFRSFTPAPKGKGEMLEGETERELAEKLLIGLKKRHAI